MKLWSQEEQWHTVRSIKCKTKIPNCSNTIPWWDAISKPDDSSTHKQFLMMKTAINVHVQNLHSTAHWNGVCTMWMWMCVYMVNVMCLQMQRRQFRIYEVTSTITILKWKIDRRNDRDSPENHSTPSNIHTLVPFCCVCTAQRSIHIQFSIHTWRGETTTKNQEGAKNRSVSRPGRSSVNMFDWYLCMLSFCLVSGLISMIFSELNETSAYQSTAITST